MHGDARGEDIIAPPTRISPSGGTSRGPKRVGRGGVWAGGGGGRPPGWRLWRKHGHTGVFVLSSKTVLC